MEAENRKDEVIVGIENDLSRAPKLLQLLGKGERET